MNADNQTSKKGCRRNTVQKQIILETLKAMGSHVSAGAIYRELQASHPDIGRATVFRVLSDMASDGILLKVKTIGGEDRFDITAQPHRHILCRLCGKTCDVRFTEEPALIPLVTDACGFTIEASHVEFIGLCPECGNKHRANQTEQTNN